jgi:hypothetical protein
MMTRINPENTQAILIGASKFDFGSEAGLQDLPSVNTNLSKLNLLLIDVVGIGKDRIHPMLDRDNSNAITSEISEILDIVPKVSDTMIVYYAGHGVIHQKKLYLATKKTKFNKPQRTGAIESNDLVSLIIEETKAKNIIFIIDCCFSAMAKEGMDSRGKKNVFFMTAAPSTQTAKDESPEDTNYTAFTHELLVILEQGIENAGEFLTFQDITNHLNKQLTGKDLPEPQSGGHGSPDQLEICKNRAYFPIESQNLPQDVNKTFQRLKTFQPIASVITTKTTQQLFENDLLYFTPTEENMMQQMGEQLAHQHQVLLLGDPATGKSMMAFTLAKQLEANGYQAYYWSLASSAKTLWDDIDALLYRKVLFIIDDCHLDIDTATELGYKFHQLPNVSAALLFVSRNISKKLQQSVQSEWFNLFEELKEVTFRTESYDLKTKVSGIIAKYQAFYQRQQPTGQYEVGDETVIMRHIRKSLVTLSYYLDLWKETPVLSEISEKQVLETVYAKYFRKLALTQPQIACLLQYACLYAFEIEFESLPNQEETTELLAEKGIIVEARKHIYAFYHSDFADLLLRAYEAYEESRFQRKYKTVDNFLLVQIKSYLLSFVADYGYPDNVHTILSNIAKSQKAFLLEKLVADDDLKKLIIGFYAEETDRKILLQFVITVLSKNTPALFNEYFKHLFDNNEYFKEVFLRSKNSFNIYVDISINLQKNKVAYNAFLANWEEQESALIENTEMRFISNGLRDLQLHVSQDKAKQLYDCFDNSFFIPKIQEANLVDIGHALIELNKVNSNKTAAIFEQVDNAFFIPKIQAANNLVKISRALIRLNQVNSNKTATLFEQVDNAFFIPKIQEANLVDIGHALIELNQVNPSKTATLFEQVDNAFFIPKMKEASFSDNAIDELLQVNFNKTVAIVTQFAQVDKLFFTLFVLKNMKKIKQSLNLLELVQAELEQITLV